MDLSLDNCSVTFLPEYGSDYAYAVTVRDNSSDINLSIDGGLYEGENVINIRGENNTIDIDGATLRSLYEPNLNYAGHCVILEKGGNKLNVRNTTFEGSNADAVEDRPASPETNQNIIIKENNTDNTSYSIPDKC